MFFKKKKASKADTDFATFLGEFTVELENISKGNKVLRLKPQALLVLAQGLDLVATAAREQDCRALAARSETLQVLLKEAADGLREDQQQFRLVQSFKTFISEAQTALRRLGEGAAAAPRNPQTGDKYDILIIDDDAIELKIVARTLEPDCNVSLALSPTEALEVMKRRRPDLILLDVNLGALSGTEFLLMLKESSAFSGIPILMRSNMVDDATVVHGLARGALDFLSKDLPAPDLRRRAFEVLTTGRSRQFA